MCCCGFTTLWAQWAASLRLWLRPSPVAHVLVAEQVCALFATVTDMFYLCRAMPVVVCISEAFWLPEDSGGDVKLLLGWELRGGCSDASRPRVDRGPDRLPFGRVARAVVAARGNRSPQRLLFVPVLGAAVCTRSAMRIILLVVGLAEMHMSLSICSYLDAISTCRHTQRSHVESRTRTPVSHQSTGSGSSVFSLDQSRECGPCLPFTRTVEHELFSRRRLLHVALPSPTQSSLASAEHPLC